MRDPSEITPKRGGSWEELLSRKGRFGGETLGRGRQEQPCDFMEPLCGVRRKGALEGRESVWYIMLSSAH